MHRDHEALKGLLLGEKIEIVRSNPDTLELTLSSTNPAVTLTIKGDFELTAYENKKSVLPTMELSFSEPLSEPHEIIHSRRRSFAERCFWRWHHNVSAGSRDAYCKLFTTQCRCGAVGEIQFHPLIHGQIKVMAWFPKAHVEKDQKACPAVMKAIAEELPAAAEADVRERPAEEEQKLAREYAVEFHRRHGGES
jgi:hypothetical protein